MLYLDPANPLLDPYRNARTTLSFSRPVTEGFVIADGEKAVLRLLESTWRCDSIYCLESYAERHQKAFEAAGLQAERIYIGKKPEMERVVGYQVHQGCMGHFELPPLQTVQQLAAPLIFLNNVRDAENVGSIVRNALALGVQDLAYDSGSCSPLVRRAIRVAMGHTPKMAIARSVDPCQDLRLFRDRGLAIIGTSKTSAHSLYDYGFAKPFVLVLGNEGSGIDADVKDCCTEWLSLPMENDINSLNVASAALAFLTLWQAQNRQDAWRPTI